VSVEDWSELVPSIIAMTADLVRIPTQGGIDPPEPILDYIESWLKKHGLAPRRLRGQTGADAGIVCDVETGRPGPRYVLDCCVDTAPFGSEGWTLNPTSASVVDGWLFGRGAADSKVGIAIFCHLAQRMRLRARTLRGTLTLLFDADEHTGRFRGARSFFGDPKVRARGIAGVMIGYPGYDEVVTACRGFLRATVKIHGTASHSGATDSDNWRQSAVEKAAQLAVRLRGAELPTARVEGFDLPPALSITAIHGGQGWTMIPDACCLNVDIRLTPAFEMDQARGLLLDAVRQIEAEWPTERPIKVDFQESWPAYALPLNSPVGTALVEAVCRRGRPLPRAAAGPSNIGNYLASLGIEATAGFGVRYRGAHGPNEAIDLATVQEVAATYEEAVTNLLS
jgi:succinyl-diaminopimelate desuccinylase